MKSKCGQTFVARESRWVRLKLDKIETNQERFAMKKTTVFSIILAALSVLGVCQAADPLIVTRVIDSVTLQLSDGEEVRLIGVDTPETSNNANLQGDAKKTGQDTKEIIKKGKKAAKFTRKLAEGKQVRLEYDVQQKDKDGRTLAYVYISSPVATHFDDNNLVIEKKYTEMFLNAALIGAGYAQAMTVPPNVKYQELFLKQEKDAKENKRGLWAKA